MNRLPIIIFFALLLSIKISGQIQKLGSFEYRWYSDQDENPKFYFLKYIVNKETPINQETGLNELVYSSINNNKWMLKLNEIQIEKGWTLEINPFDYKKGRLKPDGYSFENRKIRVNDYRGSLLRQNIFLDEEENELKLELSSIGLISDNEKLPVENREIQAIPEFLIKQPTYEDEQIYLIYRIEVQVPLGEIKNQDINLKRWMLEKYFGPKGENFIYEDVYCKNTINPEEIKERFYFRDTIYTTNSTTYEIEPQVLTIKYDESQIEDVVIAQNWYFKKNSQAVYIEPIAISLLLSKQEYKGEEKVTLREPIGWIKMNQISDK